MSQTSRLTDVVNRIAQEIKALKANSGGASISDEEALAIAKRNLQVTQGMIDAGLASGGGGSTEPWVYGPYAQKRATYKTKATAAKTSKLKIAVLGDSTADGFSNGATGTSTRWEDVWPNRLAKLLREQTGVAQGGRNWIPAKVPTEPAKYNYATGTYKPVGLPFDETSGQNGIPGGLWLQNGQSTKIYEAAYALSPGTTSVDVVITGSAGNVLINGVPYNVAGTRKVNTILNPGTTLTLVGEAGIGFNLLGIREYIGDEIYGVEMMNLSQSAISGQMFVNWFNEGTFSLQPMLKAYDPALIILVLGANDIGAGYSPADAGNVVGSLAVSIKNAMPNTNVLTVIRPYESTNTNWNAFANWVIANFPAYDLDYFDMRSNYMPVVTDTTAWLPDKTHLTAKGDELFAQVMANYLKAQKPSTGISASQVQTIVDAKIKVVTSFPQSADMVPGVLYLRT